MSISFSSMTNLVRSEVSIKEMSNRDKINLLVFLLEDLGINAEMSKGLSFDIAYENRTKELWRK